MVLGHGETSAALVSLMSEALLRFLRRPFCRSPSRLYRHALRSSRIMGNIGLPDRS
jgi:hypothetical protein